MLVAGSAIGVTVLGIFPPARKALADGYDIKGLPCPSYAADHNCSPGCGPSETCALTGWCCSSSGYHRGDAEYRLRPNQCFGGTADGWLWRYTSSCGGCSAVTFRCHDGYTVTWAGPWVKTICRYRTACG
ncbi:MULTISPECIES: hypothetical protein [unclassified Nonomuraea]|uniref:hypothetical protein n=1 Tax=unclassified Nonomuraea TaxID=2593643 RepID=UPI0035C22DAA